MELKKGSLNKGFYEKEENIIQIGNKKFRLTPLDQDFQQQSNEILMQNLQDPKLSQKSISEKEFQELYLGMMPEEVAVLRCLYYHKYPASVRRIKTMIIDTILNNILATHDKGIKATMLNILTTGRARLGAVRRSDIFDSRENVSLIPRLKEKDIYEILDAVVKKLKIGDKQNKGIDKAYSAGERVLINKGFKIPSQYFLDKCCKRLVVLGLVEQNSESKYKVNYHLNSRSRELVAKYLIK